jgi:LPXTG-motif cell wall-anchored protein
MILDECILSDEAKVDEDSSYSVVGTASGEDMTLPVVGLGFAQGPEGVTEIPVVANNQNNTLRLGWLLVHQRGSLLETESMEMFGSLAYPKDGDYYISCVVGRVINEQVQVQQQEDHIINVTNGVVKGNGDITTYLLIASGIVITTGIIGMLAFRRKKKPISKPTTSTVKSRRSLV